ncbi:MAG: hypothetical protein HKN89_10315 [Eudoraea sp.]|nr:hypothetical protein [Eudoraea sp.]
MRHYITLVVALLCLTVTLGQQVNYLQYRQVPQDRQQEFVEKETKYWAKVAKAAIDKGLMEHWALWRKVGTTTMDGPNYVFVNRFASLESIDQEAIWSDENMAALGADPAEVETNSFAPTFMDYWVQIDAVVPGNSKYAIVNYAMPVNRAGFIEENRDLWMPMHKSAIEAGGSGLTSWVCMSVIHPRGNNARFSVMTVDGFATMKDAMEYLSYSPTTELDASFQEVLSKSKMNEYAPDGFNYSIIYELVHSVDKEE